MSVKTKKKCKTSFGFGDASKKKKYCVNRCDGTVVTFINFLQGGTKVMAQSNKPKNCYTRLHIFLPYPVEVIFPIRNTLSSSDLMMMIV